MDVTDRNQSSAHYYIPAQYGARALVGLPKAASCNFAVARSLGTIEVVTSRKAAGHRKERRLESLSRPPGTGTKSPQSLGSELLASLGYAGHAARAAYCRTSP